MIVSFPYKIMESVYHIYEKSQIKQVLCIRQKLHKKNGNKVLTISLDGDILKP